MGTEWSLLWELRYCCTVAPSPPIYDSEQPTLIENVNEMEMVGADVALSGVGWQECGLPQLVAGAVERLSALKRVAPSAGLTAPMLTCFTCFTC